MNTIFPTQRTGRDRYWAPQRPVTITPIRRSTMQKVQLAAALVAVLGFAIQGQAGAADKSSELSVTEKSSPSEISKKVNLADETTTEKKEEKKTTKKVKKEKGKEGSCKGKEGSCKGKEGSCKAKDEAKGKDSSCKGKEGSCKSEEKKD